MTEEKTGDPIPTARVATRPGVSGVSERRRRIYQRHLLVFLATNIGLIALDLHMSPGSQWAYFVTVPWGLLFVAHSLGLKSRGYSFAEMLIPPREVPVKDVYTVPLDYELVRARQLQDGIANAAAAAADREVAEQAVAAAGRLTAAVETLVRGARTQRYRSEEQAERLSPDAQKALEVLDDLHRGLLHVTVQEGDAQDVPIQAALDQAVALEKNAEGV